jgi:hypothetical protein
MVYAVLHYPLLYIIHIHVSLIMLLMLNPFPKTPYARLAVANNDIKPQLLQSISKNSTTKSIENISKPASAHSCSYHTDWSPRTRHLATQTPLQEYLILSSLCFLQYLSSLLLQMEIKVKHHSQQAAGQQAHSHGVDVFCS